MATKKATGSTKKATGSKGSARRTASTRSHPKRAKGSATRTRSSSAESPRSMDAARLIKQDHAEVKQMFARFAKLGPRAAKSRTTLSRQIVTELSRHSAAEEQVVYPTMRDALDDGARLVDEAIREHASATRLLDRIEEMDSDDEMLDTLMRQLRTEVEHHIREEERELLPQLREKLGTDGMRRLGDLFAMAKKLAPTRPHPMMPHTPPANVLAGAVAGVVDRMRDAGRSLVDKTRAMSEGR